jgi:hypothetical protein
MARLGTKKRGWIESKRVLAELMLEDEKAKGSAADQDDDRTICWICLASGVDHGQESSMKKATARTTRAA